MSYPDWITPGAKVVCYGDGSGWRPENVTVTTILRVNKTSFTVNDRNKTRFKLETQSVRQGGNYGQERYCVPYDSPKGKAARERARWRNATHAVGVAYRDWDRDSSDANRDALIAALRKVPDRPQGVR